ncbi:hypothetical protein ACN4EK_05525 [Pantanalinema rosaneae CENA516]|uniref:hypothetical protein n=1 Tax=Pantanalinema rosaneae TaxID=1620701 RepID=UPI003D6E8607
MLPFQKISLTELQLNGITSFDVPLGSCSAQEIIATLMLHHSAPLIIQRVLNDLTTHLNCWNSFLLGPGLPSTNQGADLGTLVCLRDLWTGWNANTLYILVPNAPAARSLVKARQGWGCSDVVYYPIHFRNHSSQIKGQYLVMARWQQTVFLTEEMNFATTYNLSSPQFDPLLPLGECSPQALVAGLFLQHGSQRLHAPTILDDLQANSELWYSFVAGPRLPSTNMEIEDCLSSLCGLPDYFWIDSLYVWSRSRAAAEELQILSHQWKCRSATILDSPETARLLAIPKGPPIIVISW